MNPILAYKIRGEPWMFMQETYPGTTEDYQFGRVFYRFAVKLLSEGKIKVHPTKVGKGLESVLAGLDDMRHGKVSREKLVYSIA